MMLVSFFIMISPVEIDPVEEFEDILTFDKANIIMGALEKKYKSISLFGEWVN